VSVDEITPAEAYLLPVDRACELLAAHPNGEPLTPVLIGAATAIRSHALRTRGPLWMYAIQAGEDGPIKLGVSKNPAQRLKTIQTGHAAELRGLAAWRCLSEEERMVHDGYRHACIRGEWFHPVPELLRYIKRAGTPFEDWDW
jgi:hypothetical protein